MQNELEVIQMTNIFKFSNIDNSKIILRNTWNEFRNGLANKQFRYDEIDAALEVKFLRVFDDLFSNGHHFLEKRLVDVLGGDISIVRAARIKDGDSLSTYERFIPNAKYIRASNRFSPPGMEWLYLAIAPLSDPKELALEEKCALKECRANVGEHFALCKFKCKILDGDLRLVDLTIAKELEYDAINQQLEQTSQHLANQEVTRILTEYRETGVLRKFHAEGIILAANRWAVFTYAHLLADEIFLPITTEDKDLMYAPFQCLAQYFLTKGYCGIVYSSTVFPMGKNVVLFDKKMAEPYGDIKKIVIPEDF